MIVEERTDDYVSNMSALKLVDEAKIMYNDGQVFQWESRKVRKKLIGPAFIEEK